MPPKTREWIYLPRTADLTALFAAVRHMECLSVVGVSNLGKSATLRSLTHPQVQAEYLGADAKDYLFIYIDFNQMLEMSDQAFYELLLRCSIDAMREAGLEGEVLRRVEGAYTSLVAPASAFEVPLRFAQAMAAIGDQLPQRVIFLLDEVDGPVAGIDGRVFLNLRALRDRHQGGLAYITATNRRLGQIRSDPDVAEFAELFAYHTLYISMLQAAEIEQFVARFAREEGVTFSDEDLAFIRAWAGGHPALLETTCRILGLLTGRPVRDASQDWIIHRRAAEVLAQDLNVQAECRKIWNDLADAEQAALLAVCRPPDGPERAGELPELDAVVAKHLIIGAGPERRIFARAFAEFVQRQLIARRPSHEGIRLDPDSGEVWINGAQVPTLTNLEYRLLLLLYGRLGKICTKYEVVEAVWGEEYIDEVDDARIEKLVSRLRQKIEPDIATPRYVLTVRGRGYKLVEG
jgi:DNA-binding winged helix-turn-helix (wHTH) protein